MSCDFTSCHKSKNCLKIVVRSSVNLGQGKTGSRVFSLDLNIASEVLPSNSSGSEFQTAGAETNTGKMVLLEGYGSRRMVVLDYYFYY